MYNLFLITLTFGVFIWLQVILYKRDQSLFIDVLCIHTHVLRTTVTQGFFEDHNKECIIFCPNFLSNYEQ